MQALALVIGLFIAAVLLAAAARRVGAPYPVFLALGGVALAFLPGMPPFALPPDLVLALFVAMGAQAAAARLNRCATHHPAHAIKPAPLPCQPPSPSA